MEAFHVQDNPCSTAIYIAHTHSNIPTDPTLLHTFYIQDKLHLRSCHDHAASTSYMSPTALISLAVQNPAQISSDKRE